MRTLSPIRSLSPGPKPKIVFNYQPSPLKQRPSVTNNNPCQYYINISPAPKILQEPLAEGICSSCPKQATYKTIKEGRLYCSSCAIGVMNKGVDVARIQLKDQQFYKNFQDRSGKENHHTHNAPRINQFSENKVLHITKNRQLQLNDLLKGIIKEHSELTQLLDKLNSTDLTSQGIKSIYHHKKLALKRHYQRIKAAIKQSIEKDLEELDRRQKTSIKLIDEKKKELKDDIVLLEQIKQDIEPNKNQIVSFIQEEDYQKMLRQHKSDTKNILENKEVSLKLIKQLTSRDLSTTSRDSEQVRQTQEQIQQAKNGLYDPYTYTLIDSKQSKNTQTLFSFQKFK